MIAVDGKLQNRILQSPNGDRRVIVEIHADDVRFLEGAKPRTDIQDVHAPQDEKTQTAAEPEPVTKSVDKPVTVTEDIDADSETESAESTNGNWFADENDGTPLDL